MVKFVVVRHECKEISKSKHRDSEWPEKMYTKNNREYLCYEEGTEKHSEFVYRHIMHIKFFEKTEFPSFFFEFFSEMFIFMKNYPVSIKSPENGNYEIYSTMDFE